PAQRHAPALLEFAEGDRFGAVAGRELPLSEAGIGLFQRRQLQLRYRRIVDEFGSSRAFPTLGEGAVAHKLPRRRAVRGGKDSVDIDVERVQSFPARRRIGAGVPGFGRKQGVKWVYADQ